MMVLVLALYYSLFFLRYIHLQSFFYFVVFAAFFPSRSLMPYKIHMFWCAFFRLVVRMCVSFFRVFHTRNCIPFGPSICLQVLVADYLLSVLKYKHTHRHIRTAHFKCARVCGAKKVFAPYTFTHVTWRESWYGSFFSSLCASSNSICVVYARTRGNREKKRTGHKLCEQAIQCTLFVCVNDKMLFQFPLYSLVEWHFTPCPTSMRFFLGASICFRTNFFLHSCVCARAKTLVAVVSKENGILSEQKKPSNKHTVSHTWNPFLRWFDVVAQ